MYWYGREPDRRPNQMVDIRPTPKFIDQSSYLLRFLQERCAGNVRCALVTIVGYSGSSARSLGSHMIVCEDGVFAGTVSSGCIDANVAIIALEALESRVRRRVKFGAGSPFIDIRLPCGGGIELLVEPDPNLEAISTAISRLSQRQVVALRIMPDRIETYDSDDTEASTGWEGDDFVIRYEPSLQIKVAGRGQELVALTRIALASGLDVFAYSPDAEDVAACRALGATCQHLVSPDSPPKQSADRWTAFVMLFHDHDWEPALLELILRTNAAYIGALGSRQTHLARLERLAQRGVPDGDLRRISGPIGLVPSMRNPSMLAISTLAEIVAGFSLSKRSPTD